MVLGGRGTVGECADVGRAIVDGWGEVWRGLVGKGGVSETANRAEARLISLSTKLFNNIYTLAFDSLIIVVLYCLSVVVAIMKTIKKLYIIILYLIKIRSKVRVPSKYVL